MPIDRSRLRTARCTLILALALAALPAAGATLDRIASFSAGDPAPFSDLTPVIAAQPGGSFLLAWEGHACFFCRSKIRTQKYDAAGRPLGPINDLWIGEGLDVAALPDGGFVATSWFEPGIGPLIPHGIGLHRLDALGRPIGETTLVATDHDDFYNNTNPSLAVAPNGSVVVVWDDPRNGGVLSASFYDASLHPTAENVFLSNHQTTDQLETSPSLAFQADNTALVVWRRLVLGEISFQVFGRRWSATGAPLSDPFPITQPEPSQWNWSPRAIPRPDGGWWVAWGRDPVVPLPFALLGPDRGIRIVRLDREGAPLGSERMVEGIEAPVPFSLGMDSNGRLLVLGRNADFVSGRLLDRDGAPVSDLFNLSGNDRSRDPALADRPSTGWIAAWSHAQSPEATYDLSGALLVPTCLAGKSAACLGPDGRYGVEVAWQNGASNGTAKPLPLAGNVATFGFRNAADHDVTVLLSGAGSRDLTFAATTGAALEIRVTDKTTGMVRTFNKPAGRFASRRFPEALPSGARLRVIEITRKITTSLRDVLLNSSSRQGRRNLARGFNPSLAPEPAVGETCVPTSRALCLLDGRFRAELFAGQYPNPALAILRTDKSGAFALPRAPETPLVTLTMIDGRANNGKFWVYLGGLSSSGYRVRITDLSTGMAKTYTNPVGRLDSRADRMAFQ